MSEREQQKHLTLLKEYKKNLTKTQGKANFLDFIKHVYPDYKVGEHHAKLAKLFEEIADGKRNELSLISRLVTENRTYFLSGSGLVFG